MNIYLWLLALLTVGGVAGLSYWIADRILYARREPLSRTPGDVNLPFEEVSFPSRFGLRLKGWWIPAASPGPRAVLLLHPFGGNRQGLSSCASTRFPLWQPSVDLLMLARAFHAAAYAVLLFDFRCHGESERALCAGGFTEDQDVVGAVDYVFQRLHADAALEAAAKSAAVSVVGVGTGATAMLVAIGREKGSAEVVRFFSGDSGGGSGFVEVQPPNVKRLRCLVAVEPGSLRSYLRRGLRRWSPLLSIGIIPWVDWWCRRRGGYPVQSDKLIRLAGQIQVPILFLGCNRHDKESELSVIQAATTGSSEVRWLSDYAPQSGDEGAALCPADIVSYVNGEPVRNTQPVLQNA